MHHLRLVLLAGALSARSALACECGPPHDFWETLQTEKVVAVVTTPGGAEVRVDEVLKGDLSRGPLTLGRVKCSRDPSKLPAGQWLVRLRRLEDQWVLRLCSFGPTAVDQGVVSVPATPSPEAPTTKVPLATVRDRLAAKK